MKKHGKYGGLTFIVLRDPRRSAIRFRMGRWMLLLVPSLILCLLLSCIYYYISYKTHWRQNLQLQADLSQTEQELSGIIASRDSTIRKLKSELISLSMQAEDVERKMEELKKLERELKDLTAQKPESAVAVASFSPNGESGKRSGNGEPNASPPYGNQNIGGLSYPARSGEYDEFAASTSEHFQNLLREMNLLDQSLENRKEELEAFRERMRVTPNIWPTLSQRITSRFGYRKDPFTGRLSFHTGTDIGGRTGDPVFAAADGKVTAAGYDRYQGNYIVIDHGIGIQTRYMHLSKFKTEAGKQVQKGEVIGLLGSTGRSTGPHLHYEVFENGKVTDPKPYLPSNDGKGAK